VCIEKPIILLNNKSCIFRRDAFLFLWPYCVPLLPISLAALLSQAVRLPTVPETLLKKRRLQQSLKEKKAKAREAAFAVKI